MLRVFISMERISSSYVASRVLPESLATVHLPISVNVAPKLKWKSVLLFLYMSTFQRDSSFLVSI